MTRFLQRLVAFCTRQPWLIAVFSFFLASAGLYYSFTHFVIDTNTAQLISASVPWRKDEIAYARAFPQLNDVIAAVIDAPTPEEAEIIADKIVISLQGRSHILRVWRPDSNDFLRQEGLLLLDKPALRESLAGIAQQKDILAGLARDPGLRGLMTLIGRAMEQAGSSDDEEAFAGFIAPLGRIAAVINSNLAGRTSLLSWQTLFDPQDVQKTSFRRLVLIEPALDFTSLEPGGLAIEQVRAAGHESGAGPESGVTLRLTGPTPLADEEFATVAEGYEVNTIITLLAVAAVLFLALRSPRIIFAVLTTLMLGLAMTSGTGLLLLGKLNLISVAFAILFIGLGVDFGIQFATRYREERYAHDHLRDALVDAIGGIGYSLTLAAVSLIAGFFCFLPTEFRGVSELGLIAGIGMIIAFVLTVTFLPAMLVLLKPAPEKRPLATASLAAVDHWILRHRTFVLIATAVVVLAGLPALAKLQFDSNPMHLRSAKAESVATYNDLARDPDTSPDSISVLVANFAETEPLIKQLRALPSVQQVLSLSSFVPDDQDAKISDITATAEAMRIVFDMKPIASPKDSENLEAMDNLVDMLKIAEKRTPPAELLQFKGAVEALMKASPEQRMAVQSALFSTFPMVIAQLRQALHPRKVTLEDIPATMRRDWIAEDGSARIEVFPRGINLDNAALEIFAAQVRSAAPHATGAPIAISEAGKTIVKAFLQAGLLAFIAIFIILYIAMRSLRDVAFALGPLVLAGILTLEAAQLLGMSLDFANIIALPLMFGVGVAFHIYYLIAWRTGTADMLASSLTRAIFFSSLTTGIAFGSLCLSSHPGTAGMGKLLALSLFFTLLAAFIIVPAFLGPPPVKAGNENNGG